MAKLIAVFNNKGGVGKTVLCWNIADKLARLGKKVLLIDFDPQCNLSIAVLGEQEFVQRLPDQNKPYGTTVRAYLQRFLQSTGGEELYLHQGQHTHHNVHLVAGDFWLNVYADFLSVGSDLLSGTGLTKFVVLRRIVAEAERQTNQPFDYVLVDLPPSFGTLVRATFYSSDYFIVPCTSDNFSVYCVGLIGQMVPSFVRDWSAGLARFKEANPNYSDFDSLGRPVFAGWIFNGFDTARQRRSRQEIEDEVAMKQKQMARADRTFHVRLVEGIKKDLVGRLRNTTYPSIASNLPADFKLGGIEDANVLIQNALWQNVPLGQLESVKQIRDLFQRSEWFWNQRELIQELDTRFEEIAKNIISACG